MTSSDAAAPPPNPSSPEIDDGDEEIEYEEIEEEIEVEEEFEEEVEEEEEEVEEEEEEEVEEEDEDMEIGEDLTPVREENQEKVERTSKDNNGETSGEVNDVRRTPFVGDVNAASPVANAFKDHTAVEVFGDIKQMSPRLHVPQIPQIRLREPSFDTELDGENKKIRMVCEFHTKGWCIKGNSCRFLHIKDVAAEKKRSEILEREASASRFNPPQQSREIGTLEPNTVSDFETRLKEMISRNHNDLRPYSMSRQPLSFGSSSWNTGACGPQSLFESGLERHASVSSSFKPQTSPFSGSENLLQNNYKVSYGDWTPSVPFRPSHDITRKLLSERKVYDPIRDAIEQKSVKDGKLKLSSSDQGSSVKSVHPQSNNSGEEEKLLKYIHVENTVDNNILGSSDENKLKLDNPRHKLELRGDGSSGKNNVTDVDFKRDNNSQNESRALKYFQAELIEFIKELVKPTWREGLMSKDAHKIVVKKAVDKVLSTILPHQVPSTTESIKLYLSSSETKLKNLVEGYIEKYGKC